MLTFIFQPISLALNYVSNVMFVNLLYVVPFNSHKYCSVFHRFKQAKFDNGGSILSSSQFLLMPQQIQKMKLASKVVEIDSKIISLLSKSVKLTVYYHRFTQEPGSKLCWKKLKFEIKMFKTMLKKIFSPMIQMIAFPLRQLVSMCFFSELESILSLKTNLFQI